MDVIQAAVKSITVHVPRRRTVIPKPAHRRIDLLVVRHQRAAIPKSAQVLLDDEARRRGIAQFADLETIAARPDGLRIVLDDMQFMLLRNLADGFHVRALAIKMD